MRLLSQLDFPKGITGIIVMLAVLVGPGVVSCPAQSLFASFPSAYVVETIEGYIGPIFPPNGIGSTFRSEIGTRFTLYDLRSAYIRGDQAGELDLRDALPLDKAPNKIDFHGNFRLWRFGLRFNYQYFEDENKAKNLGELDFTGLSVGGDVDLVQRRYATFGLSGDYYFINPKLHASFHAATVIGRDEYGVPLLGSATLNITGQPPLTAGPYLRFTPPTIIGMPMHFEAYYNLPLGGSTLQQYGVRFVFRPQVYRFDLACKIGLGVTYLKFTNLPELSSLDPQRWEVDCKWEHASLEFAAYF